jgi:tRNA (adenine22-N1)-methyltransferase
MPETKLSRRLYAAFLLVEGGKILVDVGTDHALLPIALVKSEKVPSAIASDINKGPLETALKNIAAEGLSDKIQVHLANGLEGLEDRAEEIVIAGMGGELIADILSKADFVKSPSVHAVLQPMTKIPYLRRYLWDNGFSIEKEKYLEDAGHFYTVLSVRYTGEEKQYSPLDAELGADEHRKELTPDEKTALSGEIRLKLFDLNNKITGKRKAGQSTDDELALTKMLEETLKTLERK